MSQFSLRHTPRTSK